MKCKTTLKEKQIKKIWKQSNDYAKKNRILTSFILEKFMELTKFPPAGIRYQCWVEKEPKYVVVSVVFDNDGNKSTKEYIIDVHTFKNDEEYIKRLNSVKVD
jgi:hypothetical protein